MGGQAFARGALVLDMTAFNRIRLERRAAHGHASRAAPPGTTSRSAIHPQFAVKAMQSTDIFTVGGSISVNAHGMDHRPDRVGRIDSRDAGDAAGRRAVRTVSRDRAPELFHLVVGGYGLFGVILDVELDVVPNDVYRVRAAQSSTTSEFPRCFDPTIADDRASG